MTQTFSDNPALRTASDCDDPASAGCSISYRVDIIRAVMDRALRLAGRLVSEGVLSSASLGEETGEASCLTLTAPGEELPYYVQPMWPDGDDEEGCPCLELYVERVGTEWEPVPFAVSIESEEDMVSDLEAMFAFFRGEDCGGPPASGPARHEPIVVSATFAAAQERLGNSAQA